MTYNYEMHFPYAKEIFESDLETQEFLDQFDEGAVENVHGELVYLFRGSRPQFVKRKDKNLKF